MSFKDYKGDIFPDLGGDVELEISGKKLRVQKPQKNSDQWVCVQSESVEVDRQGFMLDQWVKTYDKRFPVKDFDQLVRICGSNRAFTEWYALTSALYSETTQVPLFLKGMIDPNEYKDKSRLISEINRVNSAGSARLQAFARKVELERKVIEKEIEEDIKKLLAKDKIVRVLTLNSTYLPMSITLLIDNFSPKENPDVMKDLFAREMLISYKKSLVQLIIDDPDIDIEYFINSGLTK